MAGNRVGIDVDVNDKATKKVAAVESRFDRLTKHKGFQTVTQGVGLGVGIGAWGVLGSAISGTVGIMASTIEASSNLNEQINKSEAIFKGSAGAVEQFGSKAAVAFGISKREALEAAGNFGNLFNTIGLGADVSADMSTKLVGLASDLASFNNIGTDDALEKLRSGLAGEAEPLRTMGVLINETAVGAEAANLGFKKVNGQFTEGAKVQARYSLILKQTATAQGDFARTGDTLANQQRKLTAVTEDLSAELGAHLTPIARGAQEVLLNLISSGKASTESAAQQLLDTERQAVAGNRNALAALEKIGISMAEARVAITADAKETGRVMDEEFRRGEHAANRLADPALPDLATSLKKVRTQAELAADAMSHFFDATSLKGRLAAAKDEVDKSTGAVKAYHKAIADGKITTAEAKTLQDKYGVSLDVGKVSAKEAGRETDILNGVLADNRQALLDILTAQADLGQSAGLKAWILDQAKHWNTLTKAAKDALVAEERATGINTDNKPGKGKQGLPIPRASGGSVVAGNTYRVGEDGEETLRMFSSGGGVVISGGGRSRGGSVHFHYSPAVSTASPAEAENFARMVLPAVIREGRRQHVL